MNNVGNGDQGHALVMRHEGAHHHEPDALGQTRRRIVERLVPAIRAAAADRGEAREVARSGGRVDHRRQRRRISGDDDVVAQPALEP